MNHFFAKKGRLASLAEGVANVTQISFQPRAISKAPVGTEDKKSLSNKIETQKYLGWCAKKVNHAAVIIDQGLDSSTDLDQYNER